MSCTDCSPAVSVLAAGSAAGVNTVSVVAVASAGAAAATDSAATGAATCAAGFVVTLSSPL